METFFSGFASRNQKKMSPSKEYFAAEGGKTVLYGSRPH